MSRRDVLCASTATLLAACTTARRGARSAGGPPAPAWGVHEGPLVSDDTDLTGKVALLGLPATGAQRFGLLRIDGKTRALTATFVDARGRDRHRLTIAAEGH